MIEREAFDRIRRKHGAYASWAVWAKAGSAPKSNIGDLRVLDPDQNPTLLQTIQPGVVMLGLNLSRFEPVAFGNFHDPSPAAQDYRIRFAFEGTPYYGAYMTDLIKGQVVPNSKDLVRRLSAHPGLVRTSVGILLDELADLGGTPAVVIAFGQDAYKLAAKYVPSSAYSRLVGVTHYSHYISKENYRSRVRAQLGSSSGA